MKRSFVWGAHKIRKMIIFRPSSVILFITVSGLLASFFAPRVHVHKGPFLKIEILVVKPSAPRLVLTYGEFNLSAPLNGLLV